MEAVKDFFANNPEATECFEALGMVKATLEEAEALTGGVADAKVVQHVKEEGGKPEEVDHTVTQEDLDANPGLAETGVKVGDVIKVPVGE